ncbi:hypothetical protein DYJ24_00895 [Salmonella enterica]|nr:hypothetical protein [Salmonella enterica]
MKTYPYDPRGVNPECHFIEERIIDSDNPNDRVVMLDHRPFFEGLVVTLAGSSIPLTRGTDYELEYALTPLDDSVTTPVFCGVHLINPKLRGAVVFEGQMLGGTFYSGLIEMLDELIKALNNPTAADWLLLGNRPSLYPATPAAVAWSDMLNKKYVASAVHDVELDAGAANEQIREKLTELKDTVLGLGTEIATFNYPGHIASTNPHGTTAAQAGAHPVNLKTPDTFLAYGKTLRQLTSEVRALGLQQSDIDKYISKWVSKESKGVFNATISGTRALFRSPAGESEIVFSAEAFTLKSNGSVVLACGYADTTETVRFMEWKAGINTLRIESTGSALGMDKLTLNGTTLLTTTALMGYQQDPGTGGGTGGGTVDPDDNKLYISGVNGITFTGKGSKADPVTGKVTAKPATTSEPGVVTLTDKPSDVVKGQAATPSSLLPYEGDLSSYVRKTTLLNNQPMDTGSRMLTKKDLGLELADNTADVDKPLSDALAEAVTGLSDKGHHHNFADLQIPTASQTVPGISRYSTNLNGLADNRGVTPNVLNDLSKRLDVVAAALANAKEDSVTDFAAVRGKTWTVGSARTTLAVTDLNYFYLLNGARKEGTVSGSIDLQTTPMFQWFSPDNRMETTWQNAVINIGAGVDFSGFEVAVPETNYGAQIGLTATGMGDISVVSLLAKVRVRCDTGYLRVWVSGGGSVNVYLDGGAIGENLVGENYVEAYVKEGWKEHCLAFRADCNDPSKAAAIRFVVYDGDYPVCASDKNTKVARLQEFVKTANGLRHYLYVNMITDALYSRAEPIADTEGINLERGYIGYIDVPETGLVAGTTYEFETTFDFGMASELKRHFETRLAHGVSNADWSLTDNPKMLPLNKVDPLPKQWLYAYPNSPVSGNHYIRLDRGLFDYKFDSTISSLVFVGAVVSTESASPYCWFTPSNPKEKGMATFEGSVVVDVDLSEAQTVRVRDITLNFMAPSADDKSKTRVLRWSGNRPELNCGFITSPYNQATGGIISTTQGSVTNKVLENPRVIKNLTSQSTECLDFLSVHTDSELAPLGDRWLVRYRYIVDTQVLRISMVSKLIANPLVQVYEMEYDIPFDAIDYFKGGALAIHVSGIETRDNVTINHGLMQPIISDVDINRFHYLRSLFESYIERTPDRQSSDHEEMTVTTVPFASFGDNVDHPVTEYITMSAASEGYPELAPNGKLPAPFYKGLQKRGAPLLESAPADYTSNGGEWKYGFMRTYRPTQTERFVSVNGTMLSNYPGYIVVGSEKIPGNVIPFSASTTAVQISRTLARTKPMQPIHIVFVPPEGSVPPLQAKFTINGVGSSGNPMFVITETSPIELRTGGETILIEKRNPFHIPTRTWDWILQTLDTERRNEGNNSGEWAS